MTDLPIGLTAEERGMLNEALQQLPELLAEAQAMRGARPPSGGPQAATTPGSKPPCDLTLIAATQNIGRAWGAVLDQAATARMIGGVAPIYAPGGWTSATTQIRDLATDEWIDWYAPAWWARNSVLVPLRQARTELRRLTRQQATARLACPHCGDQLRPQPGGQWLLCDSGHETHPPNAITTTTATQLFGVTEQQVRQWSSRGKITPINPGHKPALWRPEDILRTLHPEVQTAAGML